MHNTKKEQKRGQQLCSVDLTTITEVRWNAQRLENTTTLRTFTPNTPSWNGPAKNSVDPAQPLPHWCQVFLLLFAQMEYGHFCSL